MAWDSGSIIHATPLNPKSTAGTLSATLFALMGLDDTAGRAPTRNWSFVENIPAGTGVGQSGSNTYSCDVYKCSGSGTDANDAGIDWYLGVPCKSGVSQGITWFAAEHYLSIADNPADANRGKFKRWCPTPINTAPADAINYAYSETYTAAIALGSVYTFQPTVNLTGWEYWIKLTNNHLSISSKVGTNDYWGFLGLFDSMTSVSDPMPLVSITSSNGSFSRLPGLATTPGASTGWGVNLTPWTRNGTPGFNGSNVVNDNDLWQGNKFHVSRVALAHNVTSSLAYRTGLWRGLMKPDILLMPMGGTITAGDTVVIAGETWTVMYPSQVSGASSGISNPQYPNACPIVRPI